MRHPAVFTDGILTKIARDLDQRAAITGSTVEARLYGGHARVLDPFAGTGKVHLLPQRTTGIELEPEWAHQGEARGEMIVADSVMWMEKTRRRFDVVVTSPCYGNRMADHHDAKDKCSQCLGHGKIEVSGGLTECPKCKGSGLSTRRSYRHDLGRMPTNGSSAILHYGPEYRDFHRRAWTGVYRVLLPGGLFYLNTKDFFRDKKRVRVSEWHRRACMSIGFDHVDTITVAVNGMRYGANRQRVTQEVVYVFRKPEAAS